MNFNNLPPFILYIWVKYWRKKKKKKTVSNIAQLTANKSTVPKLQFYTNTCNVSCIISVTSAPHQQK